MIACHPDDWRSRTKVSGMNLSIHQDNTVQDQIVLIKHKIILDARELKHQINTVRLCRQNLMRQTLHTIHPDILTSKQVQAGHSCIICLSAIVKYGVDIKTWREWQFGKLPRTDYRQDLSFNRHLEVLETTVLHHKTKSREISYRAIGLQRDLPTASVHSDNRTDRDIEHTGFKQRNKTGLSICQREDMLLCELQMGKIWL